MKLKKTTAFVIALGMIVGLLSVFPAAALTPAEGYASEILIDESFDNEGYDKQVLKIEGGDIEDGCVNFELSGKSGFSLATSMDLTRVQQYVIDFELATDAAYTDPWTATFIGTRNVKSASAPWDTNSGTWLGITTDKLILWHTYKDNHNWGLDTAKNYMVVDHDFDVTDAAYRVIYEGSVAEIWINEEKTDEAGDYKLMATVTAASDKKGSITVVGVEEDKATTEGGTTAAEGASATDEGENAAPTVKHVNVTYLSEIAFTETQAARYFSVWNYKAVEAEEDPLAPAAKPTKPAENEKDENEGTEGTGENTNENTGENTTENTNENTNVNENTNEVKKVNTVKLGSFKAVRYTELLMTEAEKTALNASKAELSDILEKYMTGNAKYYDKSVDKDALEALVAEIDELLADKDALSSDYEALDQKISTALTNLVAIDAKTGYIARFDGFKTTIEAMKSEGNYSEATITKIESAITDAENIFETAEVLSPAVLDAEFNKVASLFSAAGVYTKDGIPTYKRDFTQTSYTLSDFASEWWDKGHADKDTYAVSGNNGALVQWQSVNNVLTGREVMQFKNKYSNYSAKATLTKTISGKAIMSVRATYGAHLREEDNHQPSVTGDSGPSFTGVAGGVNSADISIASNGEDFGTVYVMVRSVVMNNNNPAAGGLNRKYFAYNLGTIDGALSEDKKTATFKIKDLDDVVEIYVEGKDEEGKAIDVPLATVRFSLELTNDKYTKGTFVNEVTDESVEFSGMSIPKAADGVLSFSTRFSGIGVKDVEICTNLTPAETVLVSDGKSDPTSVELKIEDVSTGFKVDEAKTFSVDASFDNLKTYGKDEYGPGTVNVSSSSSTVISTTLNGNVLAVDAAAGTLKGVRRGTDVLTATYTGINKVFTNTALVTVEGKSDYVAPTNTALFNKTVTSARIANDKAFKSVDAGFGIIPVIEYTLPNGDTGYLSDEYYVGYGTTDSSVIAYDYEKGKFVANKAGVAEVWAIVGYGTDDKKVTTDHVSVEVVEAGTMTPGVSTTASVKKLLEAAKENKVTAADYVELLDAAIEAGVDISYGEADADKLINAQLIKNELAALDADEAKAIDAKAVEELAKLALEVRKVYDVMADEESTADSLVSILFTGSKENSIGADLEDYGKLTSTRKSTAVLRVYNQLGKVDIDTLSSKKISVIMKTVIDGVKGGGGSGTGTVTRDDKTTSGSFGAGASISGAASQTEGKKLLSGDEARAHAEVFADVNDAAWAKEAIGAFCYEGVICGYEDGTIRPNNEITRDEFVKLLVCALGFEIDPAAVSAHSDIPAGSWQIPYVAAGVKAGIVNGTGTLTFGSGESITRQDMATMIYRAVLKLKASLTSDRVVAFKDAEMIAGYAAEAVNKLAASGVISGMGDDTFAPAANATRAQAISMLYNVMALIK